MAENEPSIAWLYLMILVVLLRDVVHRLLTILAPNAVRTMISAEHSPDSNLDLGVWLYGLDNLRNVFFL